MYCFLFRPPIKPTAKLITFKVRFTGGYLLVKRKAPCALDKSLISLQRIYPHPQIIHLNVHMRICLQNTFLSGITCLSDSDWIQAFLFQTNVMCLRNFCQQPEAVSCCALTATVRFDQFGFIFF